MSERTHRTAPNPAVEAAKAYFEAHTVAPHAMQGDLVKSMYPVAAAVVRALIEQCEGSFDEWEGGDVPAYRHMEYWDPPDAGVAMDPIGDWLRDVLKGLEDGT